MNATPSSRPRRLPALAALFAVAIAASASGQSADEAFLDSSLDGTWSGTLSVGKDPLPLALAVNAGGGDAVVSVLWPDSPTEVTGLVVVAGAVTRVVATTLQFRIADDATPIGRLADTAVKLTYKAATGNLQGKTTGTVKGKIALAPMDSGAPLRHLWTGSFRRDGIPQPILLQLEEQVDGSRARLAASAVTGNAWVGGMHGTVTGTRDGSAVDLAVDLGSEVLTWSGKLVKGLVLGGRLEVGGASAQLKLLPAPGKGRPARLVPPQPTEIDAGSSTRVLVRGRNLTPGGLVHVDDPSVAVTEVEFASPRQLAATLAVPADVPDGTRLSLLVTALDGQRPRRTGALTVRASGGGGDAISFAAQVQPIFTASCALAGCHAASSAQAGMVLDAGAAYGNIVGVPSSEQPSLMRIQPGNADASYLVRKIRGDSGITGGRMPLNRTPLSAEQIATIVTWVNQGAANNRLPR